MDPVRKNNRDHMVHPVPPHRNFIRIRHDPCVTGGSVVDHRYGFYRQPCRESPFQSCLFRIEEYPARDHGYPGRLGDHCPPIHLPVADLETHCGPTDTIFPLGDDRIVHSGDRIHP